MILSGEKIMLWKMAPGKKKYCPDRLYQRLKYVDAVIMPLRLKINMVAGKTIDYRTVECYT